MLDLLDCLMPACHEESAVTTPTVADLTFGAVIALAVTGQRLVYACQALVLFIRHLAVAAVIEKHAPGAACGPGL
jgi:hypothetical protein